MARRRFRTKSRFRKRRFKGRRTNGSRGMRFAQGKMHGTRSMRRFAAMASRLTEKKYYNNSFNSQFNSLAGAPFFDKLACDPVLGTGAINFTGRDFFIRKLVLYITVENNNTNQGVLTTPTDTSRFYRIMIIWPKNSIVPALADLPEYHTPWDYDSINIIKDKRTPIGSANYLPTGLAPGISLSNTAIATKQSWKWKIPINRKIKVNAAGNHDFRVGANGTPNAPFIYAVSDSLQFLFIRINYKYTYSDD